MERGNHGGKHATKKDETTAGRNAARREDALAQAIEAQAPDTPDAVGEALTTVARAVEL